MKPSRLRIRNRSHDDPPGLNRQRLARAGLGRQIADFPEPVDGGENEANGRGIDAPEQAGGRGLGAQEPPEGLRADGEHEAWGEDADEAEEGAEDGGDACWCQSEGGEVDGEVEVWAWEGLDHGEAEEEVARGYPAGLDYVGAEEGDDDGAAAKDDGAGEVEVGEEVETERTGGQGAAEDEDDNEGDCVRVSEAGQGVWEGGGDILKKTTIIKMPASRGIACVLVSVSAAPVSRSRVSSRMLRVSAVVVLCAGPTPEADTEAEDGPAAVTAGVLFDSPSVPT